VITRLNGRICTPALLEGWLQMDQGVITALGLAISMTIAPELPGAIDLIRRHHHEISFAVGHTDDDGSHTRQAFDAGARPTWSSSPTTSPSRPSTSPAA
jgi:N-acetylglucosamine-6-phosphate deacetylase